MLTKIESRIRYYSYFIFPLLVSTVLIFIYMKWNTIIDTTKVETIVSISASMIGVLLTVITIFLAIPKDPIRFNRLKESLHYDIYMRNVITGLILFFSTIILWFFNAPSIFTVISFMSGISNSVIISYYTFKLIKLL